MTHEMTHPSTTKMLLWADFASAVAACPEELTSADCARFADKMLAELLTRFSWDSTINAWVKNEMK